MTEVKELLAEYKKYADDFTKSLMGLSVASKQGYSEIMALTNTERMLLAEVLTEKAEAQSPKSKKSQQMVPGQVNGPT